MPENAVSRKPFRRSYFPSFRDLYCSDPHANPYAKTPSAVAVLNHLIARAAMWDQGDLERGTVQMSRRELMRVTGHGERNVRRGLVALEMNGAVACLFRGRGRAPAVYAIVDFDAVCKVVRPKSVPQTTHKGSEYGRGIGTYPQKGVPQTPHNDDPAPLYVSEEHKNSLQPPPHVAGAHEALTGGGGGTPNSFTHRPQREDWDGLAELERAEMPPSVETPKPCEPSPAEGQEDPALDRPESSLTVEALGLIWNRLLGRTLPQVSPTFLDRSQGKDGPIAVAVRANPDPAYWEHLFGLVMDSPFLLGQQGHRGHRATLAWCVDPTNAGKILSGQYEDKARRAELERLRRIEEQSQVEAEAKRAKEAAREVTRLAAEKAAKERLDAEQAVRAERVAKGRIKLPRELVFGVGSGSDSDGGGSTR